MNDVVYALSDEVFDLVVVILITIVGVGSVDVSHEMDEEMRHLVNEFERFAVLEDNFLLLFVIFPFLIFFFIDLAPVHFVVRISLRVFSKLNQKLGFILQEFKQFKIVLLGVQWYSGGGHLSSLVDLLYQCINGFAGLDGYALIFLHQIIVELVKEIRIVL